MKTKYLGFESKEGKFQFQEKRVQGFFLMLKWIQYYKRKNWKLVYID